MKPCSTCHETKPVSEFTWRKDRNKYFSDCKECRNKKARDKRRIKPAGTQRVTVPGTNGKARGIIACDRCSPGTRLMCEDRCRAGRAVLCEVMTEEERQMEYATQQT